MVKQTTKNKSERIVWKNKSLPILQFKKLKVHLHKSILYIDWTSLSKNCDSHFDILPEPLLYNSNQD